MSEHLDPTLLANWLAGELSPEELAAIDAWLSADPNRRAELDEIREVWTRAGDVVATEIIPGDDVASAQARWATVRQVISTTPTIAGPQRRARTREFSMWSRSNRWRRWGLAVAASLAALAIGGRAAWRTVAQQTSHVENVIAAVGQPTNVTLSDGSIVVLAPGSRLTFANNGISGSIRAATLDGQAYFRVAHDVRRPFVVTTGSVITRVLGTEFNVQAYADEPIASVTVRSGRVGVKPAHGTATAGAEVVVTPGYEAQAGGRGGLVVGTANVDHALAWTTGRLEFVSADLASVVRDLNRWYGMQIRLADTSLVRYRLTIKFDGEPKAQALARLTRLLGPNALVLSSTSGSPR